MNIFKLNLPARRTGGAKNLIFISIVLVLSILFGVVLAANAQAAYGLDKNIKQVKTADNPLVYYLDHGRGLKKAYASEAAFLSYGNKWSDVKVISQKQLDKWPEARLVKAKSSKQVYYVNNGQKALIESEQQFIDYGFKWSDIVTISQVDLNSYELSDFDKVGTALNEAGTATSVAGQASAGLLQASLLPSGQASLYLPTGSRDNIVAAFRFAAAGQNVKITKLTFTQQGVSSDSVIDAVYLTDETGALYGERNTLNNKHFELNLNGQPLAIPAGAAQTFYLKADIAPVSGVTGQTLKFSLANPLDITASSQVSAGFPLTGAEFRLVDGVKNLGKIKASAIILSPSGDKINIGAANAAVAAFRLTEVSGNEDVLIKRITLTDIGSAQDGDLRNLSLYDQDGRLVMAVETAVDKKITFAFEPGYLIKKNHYVNFIVKAAVASGDSRDVKFTINSDSDIVAASASNGYNLAVANAFAATDKVNRFTIVRAPLFLTASAIKANEQFIYRDENEALFASFDLRNNTSDITLSSFTLSIIKTAGAPSLDQPLVALDGKTGAVLGTIDAEKITNNFADMKLGNLVAAKGQTINIKFTTHIPDTAKSGDSYQVYVKSVNYHIADNNILYSDQAELAGQKMQVIKPAVYLYAGKPADDDIAAAGAERIVLGFFKVEASDETDIRLTSITITNEAGFTPLNYASGFINLALYKGGSRISGHIIQPNENSYTFDDLRTYLQAGTSVDLYVVADIAANAKGTVKLTLENLAAEAYSSGLPAEVNNKNIVSPEVQITRTALAVTAINGGSITKGERNNLLGSFNITNTSAEKVRLTRIIINSSGLTGDLSSNNGFRNLKFGYVADNGRVVQLGGLVNKPVAEVNEINMSGLTWDPGESFTMNLYIDAEKDAVAGDISLYIRDIQAKGVVSNVAAAIDGLPTDAVSVSAN